MSRWTPVAYAMLCSDYEQVELLLHDLCHRFVELHGGDWEEYRSEANELFMDAHHKYDPEKGSYPHWIWFKVWKGLQENRRKEYGRNNRLPRVEIDLDNFESNQHRFDLNVWVGELSDDARKAVLMVLQSVFDLKLAVATRSDDPEPLDVKKGLKEVLREYGWTWPRIKETFKEIRRALQ